MVNLNKQARSELIIHHNYLIQHLPCYPDLSAHNRGVVG